MEAVETLTRLLVSRVISIDDFCLLLNSSFLLPCEVPVPHCLSLFN